MANRLDRLATENRLLEGLDVRHLFISISFACWSDIIISRSLSTIYRASNHLVNVSKPDDVGVIDTSIAFKGHSRGFSKYKGICKFQIIIMISFSFFNINLSVDVEFPSCPLLGTKHDLLLLRPKSDVVVVVVVESPSTAQHGWGCFPKLHALFFTKKEKENIMD